MKKLPENWKEIVHERFSEGAHLSAVLKDLGIPKSTHRNYHAKFQEYYDAIEDGRLLSEAWWSEQGRENVTNKNFNNTLFIFMMKSVFKWRDTHNEKDGGDDTPSDEEKARLLERFKTKEKSGETEKLTN